MPLGRLAARWGAERLPKLSVYKDEKLVFTRQDPPGADASENGQAVWVCDVAVNPSQSNYLVVRSPTTAPGHVGASSQCRLGPESPGEDWDAVNQITWTIDPGEQMFLVPVGCSPGATSQGRLDYASPGEAWDAVDQMTWTIAPGDRTFLLPVGCSPGWVWRRSISRIRLSLPAAAGAAAPEVELVWIDEQAGL